MTKQKYEEQKKKRKKNKEKQKTQAKKKKMKVRIMWAAILLLVVGGLGSLLYFGASSQADLAGEFYATQGDEHIFAGEEAPYEWNTYPPTGGWHDSNPLPGNFYATEQNLSRLIHDLEHGGVVIYYKDSISDEDMDKLKVLYEKYKRDKVVVVPLNDMETNFALTAWQYLDKFEAYDETRIVNFISDHLNKGPEAASI